MNQIIKAARFAAEAHKGQTRKYAPFPPYITHPLRVAGRIMLEQWATEEHIIAAICHDVLEDTKVSFQDLVNQFGYAVASLVDELTNKSKSSDPLAVVLPRAMRKAQDRDRIAGISWQAKAIKLADRADNLSDLAGVETLFRNVYLLESKELLKILTIPQAPELVAEYQKALNYLETNEPSSVSPAVLEEKCRKAYRTGSVMGRKKEYGEDIIIKKLLAGDL